MPQYKKITESQHGLPSVVVSSDADSSVPVPTEWASPTRRNRLGAAFGVAAAVAIALGCVVAVTSTGSLVGPASEVEGSSRGLFDEDGRFLINDFDTKNPFSSFLPGLGGLWGIPMWAFYVNRGQAVATFGTQDKDGPILEFDSANKAYQEVSTLGFRTLLRGERGGKKFTYQPFFPIRESEKEELAPSRSMAVGMNELVIEEDVASLGLNVKIVYYTVPSESFASFVREVTFTNTGSEKLKLEALDGLAKLEPFGVNNGNLKSMGRTSEAWMNVYGDDDTAPFFHISQSMADAEEVAFITKGNWALSFDDDGKPLPVVVDPAVVFGLQSDMISPDTFFGSSLEEVLAAPQVKFSKTPCAFSAAKMSLAAGGSWTLTTAYGNSDSLAVFQGPVRQKLSTPGFFSSKRTAAVSLVDGLTDVVKTTSNNKLFDAHVRQMYLDNLLRGGVPMHLGSEGQSIFHVFSRIHGDLERDYNNFNIDPTYFSQGPGNYRDVSQNRRMDIYLDPKMGDFNIRTFMSFTQADGYNPLTVSCPLFYLTDPAIAAATATKVTANADSADRLASVFMGGPWHPGQLFNLVKETNVTLALSRTDFLNAAVDAAEMRLTASFPGDQTGFWADHWTYDLDHVDSYLAIFPDKLEDMMWDSEPVATFMSPATVNPRDAKYIVKRVVSIPEVIRQYSAVALDPDKTTAAVDGVWQPVAAASDDDGETTPVKFMMPIVSKLVLLATMKFALLDPSGMGLEMEAGKPGWNDAMNGLPGMLGSSMAEAYETMRLIKFLVSAVGSVGRPVVVPSELSIMMLALSDALAAEDGDSFTYWDSASTAREEYRAATRLAFEGTTVEWSADDLGTFLAAAHAKLSVGAEAALALNDGLAPTYFTHEPSSYTELDTSDYAGRPHVRITAFKPPSMLPNFLEGPMRQMKTLSSADAVRETYLTAKATHLYDSELGMWKICESLKDMSSELGRMKAFSPGWLENESIWTHMSYKWYLELLRGGLFDEFWAEAETGLVFNLDPDVYGRPTTEVASFLTSSSWPDKSMHGVSFLPRLSGATAEFLSMWALITAGPDPFFMNEGEVALRFRPAVPSGLFDDEGKFSFQFLTVATVTYHNAAKENTWELTVKKIVVDGAVIDGEIIPALYATAIRDGEVSAVDVFY